MMMKDNKDKIISRIENKVENKVESKIENKIKSKLKRILINKYICLGLFILLATMLTGCTTKYSTPLSKEEVLKRVATECPNENYTLIEEVENEGYPKEITYKFKTDRGLEFEAVSTIGEKGSMGGSIKDLERKISVNYWDSIFEQYADDIRAFFPDSQGELYYQVYIVMEDPQSIEEIADRITQAQEIFSPELEYNSKEWLEENSKFTITISYSNQGHGTRDYPLTGISDRERIVADLQELVDQCNE